MIKQFKYLIYILLLVLISACSSGSDSSGGSSSETITYGGVDQVASAAYYFNESGNAHSAMLRLTSASSGILYFNSSVSPRMNLKASIESFDIAQSNCLPSVEAIGVFGGVESSFELSLANCVSGNNGFVATLSVKKDDIALYESNVVFRNIQIASFNEVKALSDLMPESDPNRYYIPMANLAKLNFNISSLGITPSSLSDFGKPFGELMANFVSGTVTNSQIDMGSADVIYQMVDSTSLMVYISNIQINNSVLSAVVRPRIKSSRSIVANSAAQQIECNVIVSGMLLDNQLNPDMHGFMTGCNGVVSTTIGNVEVIDGTITVYGLN